MRLLGSNFELDPLLRYAESATRVFSNAFLGLSNAMGLLMVSALALGLPSDCFCQLKDLPVFEQPVFNVPNSTDAKLGKANSEKISLQPANPMLSFGRSSLKIQSVLKPFAAKLAKSTVVLETEYGHKTLGTVISGQGYIIGKHSELGGNRFFCHLGDQKIEGRSLAYHRYHDLVLIAVDKKHLADSKPISFPRQHLPAKVGHLVVSVNSEDSSPTLGVISVTPQRFNIQQPTLEDGIDLGLIVSPFVVTKRSDASLISKGLEVERVYPRSVSERTGLYVGDLVQSVNGVSLSSQFELKRLAKSLRVGQKITVEVIRDGKAKTLTTRIESFAPKMLHDRWGGGPFSDRRFGFDKVIAHDSIIEPEQCGGPLVDLKGNVIGINIARSMRVASFAIPLEEVERFARIVKPDINLVQDR